MVSKRYRNPILGVSVKQLAVTGIVMLTLCCVFIISGNTAHAAINPQINFQGKLTNTDGTNVADGTYSIVFTIYSGGTSSGGGSSVWTETQSPVSVSSGNFQVQLGSVNATLSSAVDFNTSALYLGIKVGADAEMLPRIQFTATPYAFNSEKLGGITSAGFLQLSPGSQQTGNLNISGNITAGGTYNGNTFSSSQLQFSAASAASVLSANSQQLRLDSGTSGTVAVGDTNATAVTLGKAGTVTNTPGGLNINSGTTVPVADQLTIDNTSSTGVATAGVNGASIKYKGGAGAIESSGLRVDYTPGSTSGSTWSGMRVVETAAAGSGVNSYGLKLESAGTGSGTSTAVQVATGWDIGVDIQSGGIQLAAQADPAAPAVGNLKIYAKSVSGRMVPKWIGPSGVDTPFQAALWGNNIALWTPTNATAGLWVGTGGVGTGAGTFTAVTPTTTNIYTSTIRSRWASVVTTANQQIGQRSAVNQFYRGGTAGQGGFFFSARIGIDAWTAGDRLFVGFAANGATLTTVNPSSQLNIVGFGIDAGDTAITFMHNDGSGTAVKDTIASQPTLAANQGYDMYVFAKPNDSTIYYRLDNLNTGATVIDSSTATDLPVNTTMLGPNALAGNAANTLVNASQIGVNRMYIETDH